MDALPGQIFARRLRDERGRAGISQAALAERLTQVLDQKIDASAITRIEKHERAVRLDEAVGIAGLLNVPLAAMLRDREDVDEQIEELRRDFNLAQWRANRADEESQKAQDDLMAIRRLIAELEASRSE